MATNLPAETPSKRGLISSTVSTEPVILERITARLIDAYRQWPANVPAPVALDDCRAVIAGIDNRPEPTRDEAKRLTRHLLAKWPWLAKTDQDLRVYMADTAALFAAFSLDAAKHALDPVNGPAWERHMPPSPGALREALAAFDDRRRAAVASAKWLIAESARRAEEAAFDAKIEADRASFKERNGGKTMQQVLQEMVRR